MPETVVHFQIRMPPVLHEQLASWAKEDKASLNALIVGILEKAIEQHEGSRPARSDKTAFAASVSILGWLASSDSFFLSSPPIVDGGRARQFAGRVRDKG